jgi:hypothetical protein
VIIAALDISSTRLDCCILADNEPPVLRKAMLGTGHDPLVQRVRNVRAAVETLTRIGELQFFDEDGSLDPHFRRPDWVVIEQPAGKFGLHALLPIFGAITASVPAECQVGWRKASEWRHDLGAKNTKEAGHLAVERTMNVDRSAHWVNAEHDEHELDALGLGLAWRTLLEANALGATR